MASIDMTPEELVAYAPGTNGPADIDAYWEQTLDEALAQPLGTTMAPYGLDLSGVSFSMVRFDGFGAGIQTAWYARPHGSGPFPGVVVYHGYSGRAPRPLELYTLASQGVAVLSLDCRGQGGESTDGVIRESGHGRGWLTQGLRTPETYYYRHLYADAIRALEVLCSQPEVDAERVAVTGVSQGGGLSLVAAALSSRPRFVWSDIPFLCDIRRGVSICDREPYAEISTFLRRNPVLEEQVWQTIGYVDILNLAHRITAEVVVTVGLWDDICPPSGIYGTFRRISAAKKELKVMPFAGHEIPYELEEERVVALVSALEAH